MHKLHIFTNWWKDTCSINCKIVIKWYLKIVEIHHHQPHHHFPQIRHHQQTLHALQLKTAEWVVLVQAMPLHMKQVFNENDDDDDCTFVNCSTTTSKLFSEHSSITLTIWMIEILQQMNTVNTTDDIEQ